MAYIGIQPAGITSAANVESTGTVEITGNVPIYENTQTVNEDYTITNSRNAMSAWASTIASGVTVTVGTGETWTIV